jgi:hypothetical protein
MDMARSRKCPSREHDNQDKQNYYGHGPIQEMSIKGTITTRINKIVMDMARYRKYPSREPSQPG